MTAKKKPSKPSSYMKKKKECEEWERCAYIWQEKFYDQKQISGELKERADNAEAELKLLQASYPYSAMRGHDAARMEDALNSIKRDQFIDVSPLTDPPRKVWPLVLALLAGGGWILYMSVRGMG